MLTQLQKRKLQKMFNYLDGNQDGVLTPDDYDRICGRLLRCLEASPTSKEGAEIVESYAFEWGELQALALEQRQLVTLELWLSYREQKLSGPDAFETEIEPYVETVFTLLDRDADGRLSSADVRRYLGVVYQMGANELEETLQKLDPEKKGSFSKKEIGQLAREFYLSSDENAKGSWLLGRF